MSACFVCAGESKKRRGINVTMTIVYIHVRNIFIQNKPSVNHHHTFSCTLMCCLWGKDGNICFLLVRWSRCSLPSPQMWQGTWTTRTWFTSLPTERKKTRSKPFCQHVHQIESPSFDRTWLETGPLPLKEIWTVVFLHILMLAALSLYSTHSRSQEDQDNINSSRPQKWTTDSINIVSCLAPFIHSVFQHSPETNYHFMNLLPIFFIENVHLLDLCMFV